MGRPSLTPLIIAPADSSVNCARGSSLFVLVLQNTTLAMLLHISRTHGNYSAATAVLLNELFKGGISFYMAYRASASSSSSEHVTDRRRPSKGTEEKSDYFSGDISESEEGDTPSEREWGRYERGRRLVDEIFAPDGWRLAIPAILYVIQNNLHFVAASNLDVATFQVTYQLKLLTTALFSVWILKKKLSLTKWSALVLLVLGVGLVQLSRTQHAVVGARYHPTNRTTGFIAVLLACVTSALASVYFESVLKSSSTSLWVRNVQLSMFSVIPAMMPALQPVLSGGSFGDMFAGFGWWAWAVVATQVLGGLTTAMVIKYSDNIVKGFATSLAIVLSCIASALFFPAEFQLSSTFVVGTAIVLAAISLYNRDGALTRAPALLRLRLPTDSSVPLMSPSSSSSSSSLGSPIDEKAPVRAEYGSMALLLARSRTN